VILATAMLCLSLNIYHEARGEPIEGRYAVAQVTMNRAGDESRVCDEVLKPKQFSWTTNMVKGKRLLPIGIPKEEKAWRQAQAMAQIVLKNSVQNQLPNVLFYHHITKARPTWRNKMAIFADIGNHRFYIYERKT